MGFLDDLKKGLGLDNDDDAVSEAQKKADEAQQAADEAKKKAQEEAGDKAAEAKQKAEEAAEEARKRKSEYEQAAKEAGERKAAPRADRSEARESHGSAGGSGGSGGGKRTYTVKSGDTLSAIGAKYGVSWEKIAKVNNIENPDLIYPGQVFTIPE